MTSLQPAQAASRNSRADGRRRDGELLSVHIMKIFDLFFQVVTLASYARRSVTVSTRQAK